MARQWSFDVSHTGSVSFVGRFFLMFFLCGSSAFENKYIMRTSTSCPTNSSQKILRYIIDKKTKMKDNLSENPLPAKGGPFAEISCDCRQVKIAIRSEPVTRYECCCMDCRKGLQWCTEQGGPIPNHAYIADLAYFPNHLKVMSGKDMLRTYLIKKQYNTQRVVATCCWTPLVGDHPSYRQNIFVTYLSSARLGLKSVGESGDTQEEYVLPPPQRRLFTEDLTVEEQASLPPFEPPTVSFPSHPSQTTTRDDYETLQSLVKSLGPIQFMDPEYQGKPTKWNQLYPPPPN